MSEKTAETLEAIGGIYRKMVNFSPEELAELDAQIKGIRGINSAKPASGWRLHLFKSYELQTLPPATNRENALLVQAILETPVSTIHEAQHPKVDEIRFLPKCRRVMAQVGSQPLFYTEKTGIAEVAEEKTGVNPNRGKLFNEIFLCKVDSGIDPSRVVDVYSQIFPEIIDLAPVKPKSVQIDGRWDEALAAASAS